MNRQALLDIVAPLAPPPAPPPYTWIALGVLGALLMVGGVLYWLWQRSRLRRTARAKLQRTARALREGRVDPRTAAFQTGLALHSIMDTPSQAARDWAEFLRTLDQARFAREAPSSDTSAQLIAQARRFLRS